MTIQRRSVQRRMLYLAMLDPERYVVQLDYTAADGKTTQRTVSPIRFVADRTAFIALCLAREDCRRFRLANCANVRLMDARAVLAPMPIKEIPGNDGTEPTTTG
jgi:predicted DNA-binding transcriptional regulator YafY